MRSGNQHSGMSTGADDGMGGELTIIEKRRRLLECFSYGRKFLLFWDWIQLRYTHFKFNLDFNLKLTEYFLF